MVTNCANPISTTRSYVTMSTTEIAAYQAFTINIQVYGIDGVARTSGGEALNIELKEQCTPGSLNPLECDATGVSTVGDFVGSSVPMVDNGDGTYSHTLTTAGADEEATVSLYISTVTGGGLVGDYYADIARSGAIVC